MSVRILIATLIAALPSVTALAEAADRIKAMAMLERVATEVRQDQAAALKKFSAGSDGYRDGNIYPFCFRLDNGIVLTGQTAGTDVRTFPGGIGLKLFDAAQKPEGVVSEFSYLARKPPPADATPVAKTSLVRRIGPIGCGVGFYP